MTLRLSSEVEYKALLHRMKHKDDPAPSVTRMPSPRYPVPKTDRMNTLESRYAREVLEVRKLAGEIESWKFEALKFRLADSTFYTPDFMVHFKDHIEMHETKGLWREDARVKIKVAAEMFPMFRFIAVQWHRKSKAWVYEGFR